MRIALISSLFPPFSIGGAEQVASQLALAWRALGHEVDVISTCRRGELRNAAWRVDDWNGLRVWRIAPWNLYWRYDRQNIEPSRAARAGWHAIDLWNPTALRPLRAVLAEIRPDVVNTHNIDGLSPAVWQAAREQTAAVAHTLHDYHLLCPRATMQRAGAMCQTLCGLCRWYARYHCLYQRAVRVLIAPSAAIAASHRGAGWTAPSLAIIPNGVDGTPDPAAFPEDGPLRVLFLSRLEPEKGIDTLAAVAARAPGGVEFHVAGRGTGEKDFAALAARLPHVKWHGFVSGAGKHALLNSCDVYLQISECHENAPLGLLEARRYGLYLVGTEAGGIPEQIEGPDIGRLIPPGDGEALFRVMEDLRDARSALRQWRERRAHRSAAYGTHEMAEGYLRVFHCLHGSSARTNAAISQG